MSVSGLVRVYVRAGAIRADRSVMYITDADGRHQGNTMTDTKVKFEGNTREREKGGNSVPKSSPESHGSPRNKGKRVEVPSSPSTKK
jgi:hypothetical protein